MKRDVELVDEDYLTSTKVKRKGVGKRVGEQMTSASGCPRKSDLWK